jgi:hypothetical protein
LDARLTNAVYQPATGLWTVHATSCPSDPALSCFKWYQLDPRVGAVVQGGSFGYSDASVYAPAVAVNSTGNALFVFNYSGANYYPGIIYTGRDGGDSLNTLQSPGFLLKGGVGPYFGRAGNSVVAPGLSSSADVDPTDDNRFWMVSAYASGTNGTCPNGGANDDWATQVAAVSLSGPPSGPTLTSNNVLFQSQSTGQVVAAVMQR